MSGEELRVDPARTHLRGISGVYCRATDGRGGWCSADILELDDASFLAFTDRNQVWAVGVATRMAEVLRRLCDQFGIVFQPSEEGS